MITGSERMVIAGDQYEGEQTKEGKTLPKQWRAIFNAGYRVGEGKKLVSRRAIARMRARIAWAEARRTEMLIVPSAEQEIAFVLDIADHALGSARMLVDLVENERGGAAAVSAFTLSVASELQKLRALLGATPVAGKVRVRAATTEANLTDNPGYDVTSEFLPPTAAQTIAYLEGEVARLRELLGLPGTSREDVC